MKQNKFSIHDDPSIKITLGSNGLTPSGTFFIILALGFIGFLSYAIIAYVWYTTLDVNTLSALVVMGLVLVSSIVMLLVSYSLSYEDQEITIADNKLVIRKNRPFWPGVAKTVNLDQVDGIAMEKLGFNFMNVWYAFIFHKDFGADEVENFLSPHVRLAGKNISFLEYADEVNKRKVVDKLKKEFKLTLS
jgi:hypothetical protein